LRSRRSSEPAFADAEPRAGPRWLGWFAVAAVAALPVAEAVRIVVQRSHVVLYGDQALLELGARRAIHFDQLVGPYSREGFHHPGPVLFYLLAPFVRILEPSGPGLYLGAIAVSGAALIATVAVLWRRVGPMAALWAAVAIDIYCLCLRVGTLREPWNPYLVVTPMVLFVVLWAAGLTGSSGAGVWAVVIGSYEVQTHIATAGFVVGMSAILVVWVALSAWRGRRVRAAGRDGWGPARITGTAALVLIWLAPVIELWRDQPNNLRLLWDFFTSSHSTPPLGQALNAAATALTVMPFGQQDYVQTLSRTGIQLGLGAALGVVGLVIAVMVGRRRRQPMSLALAAASVLGAVLGAVSLTRAAGPMYLYLALWLAFVPLALLLAIGVALLAPTGNRRRSGRTAPSQRAAPWRAGAFRPVIAVWVVAAVLVAALTVGSDLSMGPVKTTTIGGGPWPQGTAANPDGRTQSRQDAIALTNAAERVVRPTDRWVGFTVGTPGLWPYVAGMVLELDERGVQSTVGPPSWELYFGHERAPGRPVDVAFDLSASSDAATTNAAAGTVIAEVHGAVLTYRRASG